MYLVIFNENLTWVIFYLSKFHSKICTQFNTSIRIIKSDNAKEYFSMSFSFFMSSHGILYQLSDAYTPQHNGVAKRKNRHLVETTRTLLLQYKVPHSFWADGILAACYLIDRMSSFVLHDQIPYCFLINLSLPCSSCHRLWLFCSYSHSWPR